MTRQRRLKRQHRRIYKCDMSSHEQYDDAVLQVSMNELSNHDHSRFLTRNESQSRPCAETGGKAANENSQ